jgi:hypothetical protein
MKTTFKLMILALIGQASLVHAAARAEQEMGLGGFIFLGFLALILVFQAIPGLLLFVSMLKGLSSPLTTRLATITHRSENLR